MNIVEIIKSYGIELEPAGELFRALCPFHDDRRTPNLMIYPESSSFFCYACQKGGNAIKFISLMEGIPYHQVQKDYQVTNIKNKLIKLTQKKDIDFKNEIKIMLSNECRKFLQEHPDKFIGTLNVLKKVDEKFGSMTVCSYTDGKVILDKFKKYLSGL